MKEPFFFAGSKGLSETINNGKVVAFGFFVSIFWAQMFLFLISEGLNLYHLTVFGGAIAITAFLFLKQLPDLIESAQKMLVHNVLLSDPNADEETIKAEAKRAFSRCLAKQQKSILIVTGQYTAVEMLLLLHKAGNLYWVPLGWVELRLLLYWAAFNLVVFLYAFLKKHLFGRKSLDLCVSEERVNALPTLSDPAKDHRGAEAAVALAFREEGKSIEQQIKEQIKSFAPNFRFGGCIYAIVIVICLFFLVIGIAGKLDVLFYLAQFLFALVTIVAYGIPMTSPNRSSVNKIIAESLEHGRYEVRSDMLTDHSFAHGKCSPPHDNPPSGSADGGKGGENELICSAVFHGCIV